MKALQYDSSTKTVSYVMEILSDFVFVTMSDIVSTASSVALSYPAGDTVGQPLTIAWTYNITPV